MTAKKGVKPTDITSLYLWRNRVIKALLAAGCDDPETCAGECLSANSKEKPMTIKDVIETLSGFGVSQKDQAVFSENLDSLIHDVFSSMASDVNNQGLNGQITWLYDNGVDLKEILAVAKGEEPQ